MTTDRSEQSGPEVDDALDKIAHDLESWCKAYPTDIFPEPAEADLKWLHEMKRGLCDRISASMGRHMVEHMRRMAEAVRAIESSHQQAVEALTKRAESAEARLARVAGVLADLHGRLTPSADFLADQIAAAIAPQEGSP